MRIATQQRRKALIVTAAFCIFTVGSAGAVDKYDQDSGKLASLLNWHEGSVVADVGAGDGEMTLAAAQQVGVNGRVYATELDSAKFARLQELARTHTNIIALGAASDQTNLPPDCCESIFMRLVYHHLTRPAEVDASLFRSLNPGGLLAVIDEEPRAGSTRPEGVPKNRIGHGIPQKVLAEELTGAGFVVVKSFEDWPVEHYCVIFRKPRPN